jgi:hypothetical protein
VSALRSLLENLIDYAGLFPPAALPIQEALSNYARYCSSPDSWMLARFVLPAARLHECTTSIPVSALIGPDLDADLDRISRSPFRIDTVELKTTQIETAMSRIPSQVTPYFEITDLSLIPAIAAAGARAKIRTGGITAEAFPSAAAIAQFLVACAQHRTPFKATAGLHHPLRCYRPLTYSAGGPSGWMFGFLNVFLAAALARREVATEVLEQLLVEESPNAFKFGGDRIAWSGHMLATEEIAATRREFAISFGSCSFEEPVADLKAIGI